MARIEPFRAVRACDDLAQEVIAPPYDVVSEEEARALTQDKPHSFLHVTRSEVDLAPGTDAHSPEAYQMARANLERFLDQGWLQRDDRPGFYLYRQIWQGREQAGLMAAASVQEYDQGKIRKHELTRPDKEQDRVDHMEALSAQVGLVFLAYRDEQEAVKQAMARARALEPAWQVTTEDGVEHALTPILDPALVQALQEAFAQVETLYIADGHHRSAAASRVCAAHQGVGGSHTFLAGLFPDSELRVLAYNRLVHDLHGHSPEALLEAISQKFEVSPTDQPQPEARGVWTFYLEGQWYRMTARAGVVPADPVGRLDVSVLQNNVLEPLLGIQDPRRDTRISFVGGIRGHQALSGAVDQGKAAIAFHLYPTGMDQLFDVADAGELMPPKSTWFEPKLRGGVVARLLQLQGEA